MTTIFKKSALAIAAAGLAIPAVPAAAIDFSAPGYQAAPVEDTWNQSRRYDRNDRYGRYDNRRYYSQSRYAEPVHRNTRTWRGNDGRYYCQKKDGTTGLIVGAAAGALLGREVDSRGDRTLGTVLGAAAGALLGKQIDQGTSCR